ncbi:11331_t:CDS:2 [Gigaspora margarita]|uniref:11331_t:CDS:1 n=1 Tax=Gigaspora margarita TaxID=4874 RepID=A0ABN7UVW3_GIGMA|nr:11331_t:CDS:2 [Gigaspora margarita]
MSLDNQYQLDSYNNDIIALSNESNVSDISENPNDPDIESNSSSPEQSTLQNNGVTVITNSLDFYPTITSITVKACCRKINESMLSRWSEPSLNSLIASFLDPRFKKMSYITSAKKNETLTYLYTLYNNQERSTSIQEPSSTNSSFFASFYDDDNDILIANKNSSSVEEEVALYDNLSQIPKYYIKDEEYSKNLHILYKQSQEK